MKLYLEPLQTAGEGDGAPRRVARRGRWYEVHRVAETWSAADRWWMSPDLTGRHRAYYRVEVLPRAPGQPAGGFCRHWDIFEEAGQWYLSRVLD